MYNAQSGVRVRDRKKGGNVFSLAVHCCLEEGRRAVRSTQEMICASHRSLHLQEDCSPYHEIKIQTPQKHAEQTRWKSGKGMNIRQSHLEDFGFSLSPRESRSLICKEEIHRCNQGVGCGMWVLSCKLLRKMLELQSLYEHPEGTWRNSGSRKL